MLAKLLLAASLTLAGCAAEAEEPAARTLTQAEFDASVACPAKEYQVRVSPALGDTLLSAAAKATSDWQRATSGRFRATVAMSGQARQGYDACVVNVVPTDALDGDTFASGPSRRNPDGTLAAGVIAVNVAEAFAGGPDADFLHILMLHELGHQLGLGHDEERGHGSVMWPFLARFGSIACEDERRACGVWGCQATCEGDGPAW